MNTLLRQCVSQMDSRQIAAHQRAGELPSIVTQRIPSDAEYRHYTGAAMQIQMLPRRNAIARALSYACAYVSVFAQWRDHAAAKRAGHLAAITPAEPIDPQLIVIYLGVAVCIGACFGIAFYDRIADRINTLWPVLVAALS